MTSTPQPSASAEAMEIACAAVGKHAGYCVSRDYNAPLSEHCSCEVGVRTDTCALAIDALVSARVEALKTVVDACLAEHDADTAWAAYEATFKGPVARSTKEYQTLLHASSDAMSAREAAVSELARTRAAAKETGT